MDIGFRYAHREDTLLLRERGDLRIIATSGQFDLGQQHWKGFVYGKRHLPFDFFLLTKALMEESVKLQRVSCDWQVEPSPCWQLPPRKDESRETEARAYLHSETALVAEFLILASIACVNSLRITCAGKLPQTALLNNASVSFSQIRTS